MQCPKCKEFVEENSLKCKKCGTRIATVCKKCGTVNPIMAVECVNCHEKLLRICTECGSANLPHSKSCRKCGLEFVNDSDISPVENKTSGKIKYHAETTSQQKVKSSLIEAIKDPDISVITLNGESGSGKNLIIRYVINDLKSAKVIWLSGTCTQITQLSPFGYFQDLLLNFFNINNFCPDTLQLKKNSIRFFRQDFPTLSNNEILLLLNLLYPENLDKYENIYKNKAKMFIMMKKVFVTIVEKMKSVFIIDNFENIDGMSYDFLNELLKDEFIIQRCKFIILSKEAQPGMGKLLSTLLSPENYLDLTIASFTQNQVEALISQYRDINIGHDFAKIAAKVSHGNPAIVEQMVMLYKDIKRNGLKHIQYDSLESILDARLSILKQESIQSYRLLCAMSILGHKFYPAMLENFDNNEQSDFEQTIENLVNNGYIVQLNSLSFEFKSYNIWKSIVSIVKNDDCFEEIMNILYETLSIYKQSSIALLGYIVQKLNNNDRSFEIWTTLMKQSSFIGDIGLYIISQKQALKLIEHKTSPYYLKIKKNIYTRVGKLLEPIDYNAAFDYLQKAIMMLDDNEEMEHIDLLSYLASSSMKKGNYWGAIECAESVLTKIPEEMELERALIKSRESKPLVRLGNYGQAINLIDNDIMPILQKYLSKGKNSSVIDINTLYEIWIDIYFDLAEALTFQGDSRMFDISKLLFDIVEKNKVTNPVTLCKVHLTLALANTIKGDLTTSEQILDDILKEFSLDNMDSFVVSRWNFIDILNKFLKADYDSLMPELFNVVSFANNANDNFTKNILKTLLAKILKDKNETKRALEILEEQVTYFAKEKVATGVLLSWYLIANLRLVTKGTQFALDIAVKALDVAQASNINNYYFIALFNKLIGEIYIAKQDYDSALVYIEKSIFLAKQFSLFGILVKDYILYAKYYQELALPKTSARAKYIKEALRMYHQAKNVPIVQTHPYLLKIIKEELSILTSFCKLNGIVLKKSTK